MKTKLFAYGAGAVLSLGAAQASAIDTVGINGFLTVAGTQGNNDANPYLNGLVTDNTSFDNVDTRLGLQITAAINDRMDLTAQLLSRGGAGAYNLESDWAFVSYHATDALDVRAGKVKLPSFLASDYIEVGYAYPWIRPPAEVYSLNPITSISGIDLLYRPSVGNWSFLVQPFFGNSKSSAVLLPQLADLGGIPKGTDVSFEAREMIGVNLSAGTDAFTVRAGYLETGVDSAFGPGIDNEKARFSSAGFTMDWHNVVTYAEYAERDEDGAAEKAFPDQKGWYATLGYRIGGFLPHVTYAELDEGKDASPLALKQTSTTIGLRYEIATGAALKFEAQKVEPDTGNYGLFDQPPSALGEKDYMLYGMALDVIF